jgi:hypothetical protein
MAYARDDDRPTPVATSQATAGNRCGDEPPRLLAEIDIAGCATIAYSSEDPAHPVEHMLDGRCGPLGMRWIGARPDTTEHIVIEFDRPQTISRLVYEVDETMRERTQDFSPAGATYQREEHRFNLRQVTHLRLTIVPNKSGSGTATLATLHLFAETAPRKPRRSGRRL